MVARVTIFLLAVTVTIGLSEQLKVIRFSDRKARIRSLSRAVSVGLWILMLLKAIVLKG